ncbi:hypothetical protein MPTK1_2g04430 [Marchantia polymorpha subsp. ruderalis]|nr:hypothetical protein Mp_2g04430 [Marchantia polymorpha subsp. ruderalis]
MTVNMTALLLLLYPASDSIRLLPTPHHYSIRPLADGFLLLPRLLLLSLPQILSESESELVTGSWMWRVRGSCGTPSSAALK